MNHKLEHEFFRIHVRHAFLIHGDYGMVGGCVRFLFARSLNERMSLAEQRVHKNRKN